MILTTSQAQEFAFQFNPYLISIIGGLVVVIGFFIRSYFKSEEDYRTNLKNELKAIIDKLDLFLINIGTLSTNQSLLEKDLENLDAKLEQCAERNCGKIFNNTEKIKQVEEKVDQLDKVVISLNHEVKLIQINHKRNHPKD